MAIATVDKAGAILRSNAAFTRLTQAGPQPAAIQDLVTPGVAELQRALSDAMDGARDTPRSTSRLRRGRALGQALPLSVAATEDGDGERAIVYALETTTSASSRTIWISRQMQAVGQLAGGIAHDFNNVLQVIINASEFLLASHRRRTPPSPTSCQIKQNAYRAAALVRQLLPSRGRQTLRPQVLELGDVLSDLSLMLKRVVADKSGSMSARAVTSAVRLISANSNRSSSISRSTPATHADGGKLTGAPAMSQPRCGGLRPCRLAGRRLCAARGRDTGTGISPSISTRSSSPSSPQGGRQGHRLGPLHGLWIVKQTGGFVFCDSAVGRGTTFRIFLPRHVPSAEEIAAETAAKEAPQKLAADHTGAGVILLVEDEDAVRALNARIWSRAAIRSTRPLGVEAARTSWKP